MCSLVPFLQLWALGTPFWGDGCHKGHCEQMKGKKNDGANACTDWCVQQAFSVVEGEDALG